MSENEKKPNDQKKRGTSAKEWVKKSFKKVTDKDFLRKYGATIYMSVALLMVAVVAISVLTINYNYTDFSDLDGSLDFTSNGNSVEPNVSEVENDKSNAQVGGNPSDVTDDVSEPSSEAETLYSVPTVGTVSKKYYADSLVFSETLEDYRTHSGIDIIAPVGSAVMAYSAGTIKSVKEDALMGWTIEIEHDYGLTSCYMNLASTIPIDIQPGKKVKAGDIIGAIGNTALLEIGDEAHLHFELKVEGVNIDPEKELQNLK